MAAVFGISYPYPQSFPLKETIMKDFFMFRRMVTPYIIMVIFWLAILALIAGMLVATVQIIGQEDNESIIGLCIM